MTTPRHRYVSSSTLHCLSILALSVALVLFAGPDRTTNDNGIVVEPAATNYKALEGVLAHYGKGLDKGSFDVMQIHFPLPTAWVWVEDDTIDGNGVEYWAVHSSFNSPSPTSGPVGMEFSYQPQVNHQSVQEFLDWIVMNNPHVNDPAELLVYRSAASPI